MILLTPGPCMTSESVRLAGAAPDLNHRDPAYLELIGDVKDRLVLGENISQAAQFIESGACDVGIIALSLAMAPAMKSAGTYWEIPADTHAPLEQGAVILKQSKNQEVARQFLEFMKSAQGQEIMTRYGFTLPS